MPNLHLALEMFHNSVCMGENVHVKANISTQCRCVSFRGVVMLSNNAMRHFWSSMTSKMNLC